IMNPFSWLQMTNMISYQGLVRTFPNFINHSDNPTLPPVDYSFQCAPLTSGRGPDGAVGAEWPAYPQASYANQSKVDVTARKRWIFAPAQQLK
ncbi:hypothetical protein, partial [Aeromonas sp. QDB63]